MINTILRLFRIVKSTFFLGILCVSLLVTVASLAVHSIQLTAQLAVAATNAAAAALEHRKAIAAATSAHRKDKAKAVARTKARERAKARIRRFAIVGAAVVPVAGSLAAPALAGSFEVADFYNWKTGNPEGKFEDYACETGEASAELVDEVLQELPDSVRPPSDTVRSWMPRCAAPLEDQPWKAAENRLPTWDEFTRWMPSSEDFKQWMPSSDDLKSLVPNGRELREFLPTDAMQDWISRFKLQFSK